MSDPEIEISGLSHEGRGVARVEGKVWFVAGALPGERVTARRIRRGRHYDEAVALEILEPSPDRRAPPCPHVGQCAGCVLQHLAAPAQVAAKQRALLEHLARIAGLEPARVLEPLVGASTGYRRRGRFSVRWVEKKGRALVGFRESNGRYVADLRSCHVADPRIGQAIESIAALVGELDARRDIPQIEFAVGDDAAALVFRHLTPLGDADRARLAAFETASGLAVLLQPGGVDSVVPLAGAAPRLRYQLPRHRVEIAFGPLDFIQVNGELNARMVDLALELLAPTPADTVLDLFCGLGNFTLPLARRAAHVVGIEGDSGLVARARGNAAANGLSNVEFVAADLGGDQRDTPWAALDCGLMLLDPPRAGAAEVLAYLPRRSVRRLVYVSCHPGTLARDAALLRRQHGFALAAAGIIDMFPHTAHVESIALFER